MYTIEIDSNTLLVNLKGPKTGPGMPWKRSVQQTQQIYSIFKILGIIYWFWYYILGYRQLGLVCSLRASLQANLTGRIRVADAKSLPFRILSRVQQIVLWCRVMRQPLRFSVVEGRSLFGSRSKDGLCDLKLLAFSDSLRCSLHSLVHSTLVARQL